MNPKHAFRTAWQPYVVAIAIIAAAAALRLWPLQVLGVRLAWLTFYPAVMVAALYGGFSAGLLGTVLSCLTVLFVLPVFVGQPFIRDSADWLGVAVFFITCTMISGVAEAMRRAQARERHTNEQLETANIKLREEINERERAEDERDHFFNLSLDLLCIAGFDGYFKQVNSAWETTLGWTKAELLSKPYLEFIHPDDRHVTASEAGKNEGGERSIAFENRYRCKDGSYKWLSWMAMPSKEQTLIYATARDITERKREEEEKVKLNAELQAANKELEAFSYSVSHDLRAPLRHINGFVEMLKDHAGAQIDAKGEHYMNTIMKSAKRMGDLIDDLLVFSRMGKSEMRIGKINLDHLVRDTVNDLQTELKDREIAWKIARLPEVDGDAAMLRQVWLNLIGNAVKYSRPRAKAEIEIGSRPEEKECVFFIRDNGVGFDPQYAGKLFGVFQRLHSSEEFEGTGIGLANVRRIINRHGGRTWAEGRLNGGAAFYFSLPNREEKRG